MIVDGFDDKIKDFGIFMSSSPKVYMRNLG
jgi:hypothetical protein